MSERRFRPVHWAGRFLRSIKPGPADPEDVAWAEGYLSERERELFGRMTNADRRHAVGVARGAAAELDTALTEGSLALDDDRRSAVVVAALLHDIGKTLADLRTYGRVGATLSGALAGKDFAEAWQQTSGYTRKVGLYLRYPELGAELLEVGQSDPWVIAWAREHHEPEEVWTIPVEVGRLLQRADR